MAKKQPPAETVLVLRCCAEDGTSRNGFKWPGVGETATAPDWKDDDNCGHGLHGWLYGQGDPATCDYWTNEDALWLVVEVKKSDIRMLGGKCKFQSGVVCFAGKKEQAAEYLVAHEQQAALVAVIGRSVTVGEKEIATVGSLGTATAGALGTATAGYSGTATAGDRGTATAGALGTATAGDKGTATAGDKSMICIKYWDEKDYRYRMVVGYVGEDGIKANVAYRLDASNKFAEVSK